MGNSGIQPEARQREKRQRLSAQARRALILARAKQVFAQHSYREASTGLLANASGITEPMLYKHFGSKKGLFLAVLRHFSDQFISAWQQRIEQHMQEGLHIALAEIAMDYHAVVKADPDVPRVIFQGSAAAADDPAFAEATERYIMQVYETFRCLTARAQEAGLIAADVNPDVASWGYMSMAFAAQFGLMYSPQEYQDWQDRILSAASRLWLRGLRPQPE
jgi:AcrR family transcriptional regulator